MDTRKKFEESIVSTTTVDNINGYVRDYRHNVLEYVNTDDYENDLMSGSGSELKSKFNAIYSSSACVVNNFTPIKQNFTKIEFLGYTNFTHCSFERKMDTGLKGTPPNLDFCLESNEAIIGVESKYLEVLRTKEAKFTDSYFNNEMINAEFHILIEKYKGISGYLDTAQLIKHALGLSRYSEKNSKKAILLYIYWQPLNHVKFQEYDLHQNELNCFIKDIGSLSSVTFKTKTYEELERIYK